MTGLLTIVAVPAGAGEDPAGEEATDEAADDSTIPLTIGFFSSSAKSVIRPANHSMLSCRMASSFSTPTSDRISCCEMPPSPRLLVSISASRTFRC
uniref:Putative secreted protein n=1 Tax=Anopheles triannulatus TaxID=58253 RepID=A0A2M4B436_9DIPT